MDDHTIVQMFWQRDENAIKAVSEKYGRLCLSISRNVLGNTEDAEECVNDAYLNVWNSIPPHKPQVLSAYLAKIVRNLSFNRYKKNRAIKRGNQQMTSILDELSEGIADPSKPEEQWNSRMLSETINAFLSALPSDKRKIFICRYWYADSVKEIADRFHLSGGNVSVILNRLRKELRDYLKESGYDL